MKRIVFITYLIFQAFILNAQTGIGTTTPAVKLHIKSNAATLRLEGTDHTYMEFYPQGAATRFGYFGYPNASSTSFTMMNLNASGSLVLGTNNTTRFSIDNSGSTSLFGNFFIGNSTGTTPGDITLNPNSTQYEGGQINFKKSILGSTADWIIDQYGTSSSDARLRIFNSLAETNGMAILENGNIGMGTLVPTVRLQVNGDIIANSIAGSSDIRFKTNIRSVENALEKVKALRGVYFNWNQKAFPNKDFSDKTELGFIAQEVEKVLPEVVIKDKTPDEYRSVKYDKVVALLVEAIKEQQSQIDSLTIQVNKLNKKRNRR